MKHLSLSFVCCAALLAPAAGAAAETYSNRPIRFIVPQTPGGTSDIVARMVAQRLAARWARVIKQAGAKID